MVQQGPWEVAGFPSMGTVRTTCEPGVTEWGLDWVTARGSCQPRSFCKSQTLFSLAREKIECT